MLVLEGLVGLHRTIQLQLLQHYWLGHRCYYNFEWLSLHQSIRRMSTNWSHPLWIITVKLLTTPSRSGHLVFRAWASPLRPPLPDTSIKLFFSTSPETLSLRFNLVAGCRGQIQLQFSFPPIPVLMNNGQLSFYVSLRIVKILLCCLLYSVSIPQALLAFLPSFLFPLLWSPIPRSQDWNLWNWPSPIATVAMSLWI